MTQKAKTRIFWTPWENRRRKTTFVEFYVATLTGTLFLSPLSSLFRLVGRFNLIMYGRI